VARSRVPGQRPDSAMVRCSEDPRTNTIGEHFAEREHRPVLPVATVVSCFLARMPTATTGTLLARSPSRLMYGRPREFGDDFHRRQPADRAANPHCLYGGHAWRRRRYRRSPSLTASDLMSLAVSDATASALLACGSGGIINSTKPPTGGAYPRRSTL